MKLLEQQILYFIQGNSDKVYEVDLCQLPDSSCVVNFRYGRRGGNLKDGSKATLPLNEKKARAIYQKLIQSKIAKGYQTPLEAENQNPKVKKSGDRRRKPKRKNPGGSSGKFTLSNQTFKEIQAQR